MVAVEARARADVRQQAAVLPRGQVGQRAVGPADVGAQRALAPRLRARRLRGRAAVAPIQEVDHVVVVVVAVVVQVVVLQELWSGAEHELHTGQGSTNSSTTYITLNKRFTITPRWTPQTMT